MMDRIKEHPILNIQDRAELTFFYNGLALSAAEGDTIAAALIGNGVRVFRHTAKYHEPRGLFCAVGQCTDCVMVVDGQPNVRTCVTLVKKDMCVQTQIGLGDGQHDTI